MQHLSRLFIFLGAALLSQLAVSATPFVVKNLDDIDRCVKQSWDADFCLDATKAFAKKNPAQQFAIGQRVRLNFAHWAALPFFDAAMGKAPPASQCADADVSLAVVSGLNLPESYPGKAVAERVLAGACFAALRPAAEAALVSGGISSYEGQSVCKVLAAKGIAHNACQAKPQVEPTPTAVPQLPALDLAKAQYSAIKVFRGREGERMTLGEVQGSATAVVVRFDGIRGDWNGKVLVHQLDAGSHDSGKLWTLHNGQRWNTVVTTGGQRSAYVPGALDGMGFYYSETDSQKASAQTLR